MFFAVDFRHPESLMDGDLRQACGEAASATGVRGQAANTAQPRGAGDCRVVQKYAMLRRRNFSRDRENLRR